MMDATRTSSAGGKDPRPAVVGRVGGVLGLMTFFSLLAGTWVGVYGGNP